MTDTGAPIDATASGGDGSNTGGEVTAPESTPNLNPAWTPLLEKLPNEFHPLVTPVLQSWDKNFQEKTTEVQSKIEPYNFLLENQIDPARVQMALGIADIIDADPRKFYDSMGEFYKDQWKDQGQQGQNNEEHEFELGAAEEDFDIEKHPKFQEMKAALEQLSNSISQDQQARQQQEADAQIEREVKELKEEFGDWDEEMVFALAVTKQIPLKDAVTQYVEKFGSPKDKTPSPAPYVFPPSFGGVPLSEQVDPAKLSGKETRNLVVEFLKAQNKDT